MLTKFESKSNRVKGLSFHPTRPWILASLHNGAIQLWDIRMGTLLDRFEEHDGPVRGIDFHHSQPLFASGGDDYKIKIWNWKLRRCLFSLLGHLDYIRTVEFHREYPWIVSASDDQTIRLWNWQSRTCISVLTGHNHYVMCASFHPTEDLVVSASLDQTVRVWDTSGLRKKTVRGAPGEDGGPMGGAGSGPGSMGPGGSRGGPGSNPVISRVNADLFGGSEAVVKYVLEGHDRGVNWASFHHTLPLIVSGADDRQVKLWRMNETKAWEVDTMRGHTNNVSCVIFHPRAELIVSNSEDRSIRVWDVSKRVALQTFRREHDRFWILAAHKEQNILAAGHDSGLIVFKLERERPAFQTNANEQQLFYVKDRYLRLYAFGSSRDVPLVSLKRTPGGSSSSSSSSSMGNGSSSSGSGLGGTGSAPLGSAPRILSTNPYNPTETNILIFSDIPGTGGCYELVCLPKEGVPQNDTNESTYGSCLAAVFIARNRFAVLEDKSKQVLIKNLHNQVTKKFELPPSNQNVDGMFPGGTAGRVLLRSDDRIVLFETQSRKVLSEVVVPRVKYVIWSHDSSLVALLCKHQIVICNRQLEQLASINESVRVKSGVWGQHGLFIYTTLNHVKYCLPNGDSGIVRTLDVPVYATKVINDVLHCLDRELKVRTIDIDTTECKFKVALMRKQYRQVLHMIRNSNLCGQAIITYLRKKGFPEVALHFVEDKKARFNLAIECGNLDVARECAVELKDLSSWHRLGVEALRQGDHLVMELSFQKTSDFARLSFLYLITGNIKNLKRMMQIAERRKDTMSRFHNALLLGDVPERIKMLEEVGQYTLAYVTAKVHNFEESAARIAEILKEADAPIPDIPDPSQCRLLIPPTPISMEGNWPLVDVNRGIIHDALLGDFTALERAEAEEAAREAEAKTRDEMFAKAGWEDEDDGFGERTGQNNNNNNNNRGTTNGKSSSTTIPQDTDSVGDGWGDGDDLDLGDIGPSSPRSEAGGAQGKSAKNSGSDEMGLSSGGVFVAPSPGVSKPSLWAQNSTLAVDHVAAGAFDQAMRLLNRQIGVVNFAPLKELFTDIYLGSRCFVPSLPSVTATETFLQRNDMENDPGKNTLPSTCIKLNVLVTLLQGGYLNFQKGKLQEALDSFTNVLQSIPLCVVPRNEVLELKELVSICREYVLGIQLELARKESSDTEKHVRALELSVYFTHCGIQPAHLLFALKPAMVRAFKLENYITAASLARRILEMPETQSEKNLKTKQDAQKVLQESEKRGRNAQKLDYDESKPFSICAYSLKPIAAGVPSVRCPFCGSFALQKYSGRLCKVCKLSELGLETLGLVSSMDDRKG